MHNSFIFSNFAADLLKLSIMEYYNRVSDRQLQLLLEAMGAVLIEGPKWTGKTTTAEQYAKSVIKLQDPDMRDEFLATAAAKPSLLLSKSSFDVITRGNTASH